MGSVRTALRVLELVSRPGGIGVSELARQLDEPKSTVQRSLATLYEDGWICPISTVGRRRWTVTTKVLGLTQACARTAVLRDAAQPIMKDLLRQTHETVTLLTLEFDHVIVVDYLDSPRALRAGLKVGFRSPLHLSAGGKAILTTLPSDEQAAYLERDLEVWTVNSISDPAKLQQELELTRKRGYGYSHGEFDHEVRGVGAAVPVGKEASFAAVAVSCPATRLSRDMVDALGRTVSEAAKKIGDEFLRRYRFAARGRRPIVSQQTGKAVRR